MILRAGTDLVATRKRRPRSIWLATATAVALAAAAAAWQASTAAAASSLSLSAGSSQAARIVADVGQKATFRARWGGSKPFPRGAQIMIRYAKANSAGTKAVGPVSSRRRVCARGAKSCAWAGEASRVTGTRAYHAVLVRGGRVITRSRTVIARWRKAAKTTPKVPAPTGSAPTGTSATTPSPGLPGLGTVPVITLENRAPVAVASASLSSGTVPLTVIFSSASSNDPDGVISAYAWDLDGDGQHDDSTAANPSFQYSAPGSYAVSLRVTDNLGAQAVSAIVTVTATSGGVSLGFTSPTSIATGLETHSVVAHDLDGDGDKDLAAAVANSSAVAVSLNNGSGSFGSRVLYPTGTYPKHAAVGDVDGDGKADLVSANQNAASITVLKGNGDGTFQSGINYPACSAPHEAAFGDLNGDGKQDVAVACYGGAGNLMSVLLNTGDAAGTLGAKVDYTTAVGARSLVMRDFDGDGDLDVAEAALSDNAVAVLRNNGSGVFAAPTIYTIGSPHNIASADLNGDGRFDLVATSESADAVGVLLGNGDGSFQSIVSYGVGDAPKATSIGDLNGDGKLDLATVNSHGNYPGGSTPTTLTILLGNGDGTFTSGMTIAANLTPFSVAIADLNGDGRNDLATANWHSGDVKVFPHS